MRHGLLLVLMAIALSGCAAPLITVPQRPVTGATARVRIDDGLPISVYPGRACIAAAGRSQVAGAEPYSSPMTYTAIYKVIRTSPQLRLGMPVTPETPKIYNEYYVEANKPVVVHVAYGTFMSGYMNAPSVATSCGPINATFVPEAGKDYEVHGIIRGKGFMSQKYCVAEISEIIHGRDGTPTLLPVVPRPTPPCLP